jgi:RHH-type rel operon transcriptional repressor/antitoxin RelB
VSLAVPTSIRLSSEVEGRLNRLAMKTGRTKAFYLRRLIEENLDVLEDAYLGQAAWEAFQASGARAIPLDSLKRDLGLED